MSKKEKKVKKGKEKEIEVVDFEVLSGDVADELPETDDEENGTAL